MEKGEYAPESSPLIAEVPKHRKPGDNPNKARAQGSKKYRPKRTSQPKTTQNVAENVEPRSVPVDLEGGLFRDEREPGTDIIGSFRLRRGMVDELILNTQDAYTARMDNLYDRYGDLPGPQGMNQVDRVAHFSAFQVYYCIATQLYETLTATEQDGLPYKLKALKYGHIEVPNFLSALIGSLGTYRTPEGIMHVKAIESLVQYYSSLAMIEADSLGLFRPGELPPQFTRRNVDDAVWTSSLNPNDMLTHLLDVTGADDFYNVAGDHVKIDRENVTNNVIVAMDAAGFFPNRMTSLTWTQWTLYKEGVIDLNTMCQNLFLRNGDVLFSDRVLVQLTSFAFSRFNRKYKGWISRSFLSGEFRPGSSGSSAQFLRPADGNSRGLHDYKVSPSEAAVGLILLPSQETHFEPKYLSSVRDSREQMFHKFAAPFATKRD